MHLTSGLVFVRRSAHCAYRRGGRLRRPLNGAPSALLHGAPSARWSNPEQKKTYLLPCFILPLHLPAAYEASGARRGCASLTLARATEVAQLLKHFWVVPLNN